MSSRVFCGTKTCRKVLAQPSHSLAVRVDTFRGRLNLVVKPEKNSIFLKNGKTVILVENCKFLDLRL